MSDEKARLEAEKMLTPAKYLRLWYANQARDGVGISRKGRAPTTFAGTGFWVLHITEILMLAIFAALLAINKSQQRFNETCNGWYKKKNISQFDHNRLNEIILLLRDADWPEVGNFVRTTQTKQKLKGSLNIYQAAGESGALLSALWWPGATSYLFFQDNITPQELALVLGTSGQEPAGT